MRAISAAIIAVAGAVVLSAGFVGGGDEQTFAMLVGKVVGLAGLAAWAKEFWSPP